MYERETANRVFLLNHWVARYELAKREDPKGVARFEALARSRRPRADA